ncbi:hypothetical protein SAMN06309944_2038 [Micrococcales bacterium KH10]|nr:hypothetical protein SAMN06309944_2038 [Micrococcales bacterium KH10]
MSNSRVALATCSALPMLEEDDVPLIAAFAQVGITAEPVVWDQPGVVWGDYDLVVVRSTWDYSDRRDEFIAWANSVPRLLNAATVLKWNTDKHYLKELAEQGVRTIDTLWLDPEKHLTSQAIHTRLPAFGDYVIKPTISAGAQDTIRYRESSAQARGDAILHVRDLLRDGRNVMVQRYFTRVDTDGETCLVYIAGEFSHAVRKDPMLQRDATRTKGQYQREVMNATTATSEQIKLAEHTMDKAAELLGISRSDLLYARVDMLPGDDDVPHLLELELTEPVLYFSKTPRSIDRFVSEVQRRIADRS